MLLFGKACRRSAVQHWMQSTCQGEGSAQGSRTRNLNKGRALNLYGHVPVLPPGVRGTAQELGLGGVSVRLSPMLPTDVLLSLCCRRRRKRAKEPALSAWLPLVAATLRASLLTGAAPPDALPAPLPRLLLRTMLRPRRSRDPTRPPDWLSCRGAGSSPSPPACAWAAAANGDTTSLLTLGLCPGRETALLSCLTAATATAVAGPGRLAVVLVARGVARGVSAMGSGPATSATLSLLLSRPRRADRRRPRRGMDALRPARGVPGSEAGASTPAAAASSPASDASVLLALWVCLWLGAEVNHMPPSEPTLMARGVPVLGSMGVGRARVGVMGAVGAFWGQLAQGWRERASRPCPGLAPRRWGPLRC